MTPLMQQYHPIKEQYQDALVLFQVGDFYELFYEDAQKAAAFLGITLTARGKSQGEPIPLCGVPVHAVDHYLVKLVQGGFRVVLCQQKGDVEPGKLVDRVVSRVISPGTLTDPQLLNPHEASVIAFCAKFGNSLSVIFVEMVTGVASACIILVDQWYLVEAEFARWSPREMIMLSGHEDIRFSVLAEQHAIMVSSVALQFDNELFQSWLQNCVSSQVIAVSAHSSVLLLALQGMFVFLSKNAADILMRLHPVQLYDPADAMIIDATSQLNLALVRDVHAQGVQHTLAGILDHAATAMGSRCIRSWLVRPLYHRNALEKRLDAVELLVQDTALRDAVRRELGSIGDCERVIGRIGLQRAAVRDYFVLRDSLAAMIRLSELLARSGLREHVALLIAHQQQLAVVFEILRTALVDTFEVSSVIVQGFCAELDRVRGLASSGERAILELEEQERVSTQIMSLKIRATGVHGYTIEVTKAQSGFVPSHYMRVQTLANAERYTIEQLRSLEHEINHARALVVQLEQQLFDELQERVYRHHGVLRMVALELATLDGLLSFAQAAVVHRYVRPVITQERRFTMKNSRHPIIEAIARSRHEQFVANDVSLSPHERIWIITGPNMGGKSTFLRQVALAVIMAQAGSFVAASHALIPLCDRVCTRIGASDNVSRGKSTFYVEMEEVSLICSVATEKSFLIIDELGRGTSAHDGVILAQSVLEYLDHAVKALGLCATHYHTLAERLEGKGAFGMYHAAVKKSAQGITLLHSILPGAVVESYGIEAAMRVGLPASLLQRAHELVAQGDSGEEKMSFAPSLQPQTVLQACTICSDLRTLDVDGISPRDAFAWCVAAHEKLRQLN